MSELDVSLSRLTALVESALLKRLVETPELAAFLELLAPLAEANARPRAGEGASLPIAARFSEALAEAKGDAGPLAEAVEALRPTLAFAQNPNYVAGPPSPAFLLNYGYAVFAGPADGPPALAVSPALAFGVLLLGPPQSTRRIVIRRAKSTCRSAPPSGGLARPIGEPSRPAPSFSTRQMSCTPPAQATLRSPRSICGAATLRRTPGSCSRGR